MSAAAAAVSHPSKRWQKIGSDGESLLWQVEKLKQEPATIAKRSETHVRKRPFFRRGLRRLVAVKFQTLFGAFVMRFTKRVTPWTFNLYSRAAEWSEVSDGLQMDALCVAVH